MISEALIPKRRISVQANDRIPTEITMSLQFIDVDDAILLKSVMMISGGEAHLLLPRHRKPKFQPSRELLEVVELRGNLEMREELREDSMQS